MHGTSGSGVSPFAESDPSRIDRAMLERAIFPLSTSVSVRMSDTDIQGHVNNVRALDILQEGRAELHRASHFSGWTGSERTLVAALAVEYAAEVHYPGQVEVRSGILSIGRTSVTIAQMALQNGLPCLFSRAVLVTSDENGPAPLPAPHRENYAALLIRHPAAHDGTGR